MLLLVYETEAGLLVDVAGRAEDAVGPERDLPVAGLARKAQALFHEASAHAESACLRLDEQETQLGHRLRSLDEEDGPHDLAVLLGDPAALALRVEVVHELGHDLGDESLEALVPAVLLRVEGAMTVHDPAHVARLMGAKDVGRLPLGPGAEDALDRVHRLHQPDLLRDGEGGDDLPDLLMGPPLERGERGLAPRGEAKVALAAVGLRPCPADQAALLEALEDAAQIARVEAELAAQPRCRGPVLVRQLIEHAHLAQREGALEVALFEQADLPRVEAVEAPHGSDRASNSLSAMSAPPGLV